MAKETLEQRKSRALNIIKYLKRKFPEAKIALRYSSPVQLLVAVILSAQCTDKKVNEVTAGLFKKYKTAADFSKAKPWKLEQEIKSTGFYRNKAKNIIASCQIIQEKFKGKVPNAMSEILTLPGVARKTANVVLGNSYGVVEGIAVDTHESGRAILVMPDEEISPAMEVEHGIQVAFIYLPDALDDPS